MLVGVERGIVKDLPPCAFRDRVFGRGFLPGWLRLPGVRRGCGRRGPAVTRPDGASAAISEQCERGRECALASRPAAFLLVFGLCGCLCRRRGLTWRLRVWWRLRHVHMLPLLKRVRGVDDDLVGGGNATENLQRGAVIASNVDGAQLHFAVGTNDGDARAFGSGTASRSPEP